jgi:hypothetical protein
MRSISENHSQGVGGVGSSKSAPSETLGCRKPTYVAASHHRQNASHEYPQAVVLHLEEEVAMQLYTHYGTAERGLKPFPAHGPHLVCALTEGSYVVQCLACRLMGTERKDSLEAKQAFDEATDARAATGAYSPKGVER